MCINDGAIPFSGLKLRESNINGDTKHPDVLEGPLVHLSGFLVEHLEHTLANTTKLVSEVTNDCRFSRVNVATDTMLMGNFSLPMDLCQTNIGRRLTEEVVPLPFLPFPPITENKYHWSLIFLLKTK